MNQTTYSAAALAAEVGVPRTTINDWLTKYADYIDTIPVGKRKVYSEESLNVLKTIASLRDSGKSSAEIEQFLIQSHGIRPEVATAESQEQTAETSETSESAENSSDTDSTTLPAVAENPANLPALQNIERSAMELTAFIADLRSEQQQSIRRSRFVSTLLAAVIVLMLGVFALIYTLITSESAARKSENDSMQQNMLKLNAELASMEKARIAERNTMEKLRAAERASMEKALAAERAAAASNAAAMQQRIDELNAQRARTDAQMQKLNRQLTDMSKAIQQNNRRAEAQIKLYANELARVRYDFAAERKRFHQIVKEQQQALQDKDVMHQQLLQLKLAEEAARSRQRLQQLQQKLDAISSQLENLKTVPAKPAAPAAQ